MARIRYTKYRVSANKDHPSVAYFHDKNFEKALSKVKGRKSFGKATKIVTLNENQEDRYLAIKSARLNPNKVRFHDHSNKKSFKSFRSDKNVKNI